MKESLDHIPQNEWDVVRTFDQFTLDLPGKNVKESGFRISKGKFLVALFSEELSTAGANTHAYLCEDVYR